MNDPIERQAAIDVLSLGKEILSRVLDDIDVVGFEREKYAWGLGLIDSYISDMKELPSAQPEKRTNKHTETLACDCISRQAAIDDLHGKDPSRIWDTADIEVWINALPSAQSEPCHENDKVVVDKDAYEQCRFEYINACKITHNRTPDTRQRDISNAYAVIKALQPIFGEESF